MLDCSLIQQIRTIIIRKNINVANNPTIKLNLVISSAPLSNLRLSSKTLYIFYEFYPSGINLSSINKLAAPQIIESPPIAQVNAIKATVPMGARPSGVDDSSIWDRLKIIIIIDLQVCLIIIIKYNKHNRKMNANKSNSGIYKKFKSVTESSSNSQWQTWSRTKKQQASFSKKKEDQNNLQWIGTQSTPPRPDDIQNSYASQSIQYKTRNSKQSFLNQLKAPAQLIQDILKGLGTSNKMNIVNPYYSEESEEKLTEILTNQGKLEAFITELQNQMPDVDISVVKNYEMLIILLKHLGKSDIQIKHSPKGLQLNFNKNLMMKQENQIQKLEKKARQKDQLIKQIVQQYESVIRNFNDVIQKLLQQKANNHHHTHHRNPNSHTRNMMGDSSHH